MGKYKKKHGQAERRGLALGNLENRIKLSDEELFKNAKRFRNSTLEVGTDAYNKAMKDYRNYLETEKKKLEESIKRDYR